MSRTFRPIPEHTESDVEYNCIGWLRTQGWVAERNPVGLLYTKDGRPHPVGRPGACDWRLKRSSRETPHYFELECKAPRKRPDRRQLEYMAQMTAIGVIATWVDSLTELQRWYFEAMPDFTYAQTQRHPGAR